MTIRDEDGDTALHAASVSGHAELTKILLEFGADHSIRNDNGDQPAHLAARKGHVDVLRLLIKYECDVNMKLDDNVNNEKMCPERTCFTCLQIRCKEEIQLRKEHMYI